MNTKSRISIGILAVGAALSLSAQTSVPNTFLVHNLVADQAGMADVTDPNLVNPWGNGFSATSPFWTGNQGSGTSTLYNGYGVKTALTVAIPPAGNAITAAGFSGPTGVIFNSAASNTSAFVVNGGPASFIFCTLDGLIDGWYSKQTNTAVAGTIYTSPEAVYTGCTLGGSTAAPFVLATNFFTNTIDVINASGALVPNATGFWVDPAIPAGFAVYNIAPLNGNFYVTYWAKSSAGKPVPGAGSGYVAVFSPTGALIGTLIPGGAGSKLNLPWGLAIAPATFGPFGGDLLVGNFGDGTINAYNLSTGAYVGTLNGPAGTPLALGGLWAINFGGGSATQDKGTLYFLAGTGAPSATSGEPTHGVLGSIQAVPSFTATTVENAASFLSGPITANEWITITGSGLSATTSAPAATGTQLATSANGVSVTVNGEAAPLSFIGNQQINLLVPADIQTGTTPNIVVTNNGLASAPVAVTTQPMAPAFFIIGTNATTGAHYVAATHANGTLIGPPTITGATPAEPGEVIVMYGTGFGAGSSAIPNGKVITSAITLPVNPLISIDGLAASVQFAGITEAGLYQFNVVVPLGVQRGADDLAVALIGDTESQPGAFITIAAQ
jgi:uncharacterized protein (TIGR03118 family)